MKQPRSWTEAELRRDATKAVAQFRRQRLDEPRDRYSEFFKAFCPVFRDLLARFPAIRKDESQLAQFLADKDRLTAFRYLGAPPISEDDLKTLAESRLSAARLRKSPEEARRVRDVVLHVIDPHRFPWVHQGRNPRDTELEQAIVASAALVAARKVETHRRSSAKNAQEQAVIIMLARIGFREVERRPIPLLDDAPSPGEFCRESKLGDTRADIVIRMHDRRVVSIECKVSNSTVNSFKRVNHEAAGKAQKWLTAFGKRAVVPAAVLAGVFNADNLADAQSVGLALFWQHRLDDLAMLLAPQT